MHPSAGCDDMGAQRNSRCQRFQQVVQGERAIARGAGEKRQQIAGESRRQRKAVCAQVVDPLEQGVLSTSRSGVARDREPRGWKPVFRQHLHTGQRLQRPHPPAATVAAQLRGNFHDAQRAMRIVEARRRQTFAEKVGNGRFLHLGGERLEQAHVLRMQEQFAVHAGDGQSAPLERRGDQREVRDRRRRAEAPRRRRPHASCPRRPPTRWQRDRQVDVVEVGRVVATPIGARPRQPPRTGHQRHIVRKEQRGSLAKQRERAAHQILPHHIHSAVEVRETGVRNATRVDVNDSSLAGAQRPRQHDVEQAEVVRIDGRRAIDVQPAHAHGRVQAEDQGVTLFPRHHMQIEIDVKLAAGIDADVSGETFEVDSRSTHGGVGGCPSPAFASLANSQPSQHAKSAESHHSERCSPPSHIGGVSTGLARGREQQPRERERNHGHTLHDVRDVRRLRQHGRASEAEIGNARKDGEQEERHMKECEEIRPEKRRDDEQREHPDTAESNQAAP